MSDVSVSVSSRGLQLGQLEVAIREHKQEMARKVESLQLSLDERERELKGAQRELAERNVKVRRSPGDV